MSLARHVRAETHRRDVRGLTHVAGDRLALGPGVGQRRVAPAGATPTRRAAEFDESAAVDDTDAVGPLDRATAGGPPRSSVRPVINESSARSTMNSVPGSRLLVASSRTSTAGSTRAARASDTSWRSPADRREPRSRTSVWMPSGNSSNRSSAPMASNAARTSSSVASNRAIRTLSRDRSAEQEALLRHDDDAVVAATRAWHLAGRRRRR